MTQTTKLLCKKKVYEIFMSTIMKECVSWINLKLTFKYTTDNKYLYTYRFCLMDIFSELRLIYVNNQKLYKLDLNIFERNIKRAEIKSQTTFWKRLLIFFLAFRFVIILIYAKICKMSGSETERKKKSVRFKDFRHVISLLILLKM